MVLDNVCTLLESDDGTSEDGQDNLHEALGLEQLLRQEMCDVFGPVFSLVLDVKKQEKLRRSDSRDLIKDTATSCTALYKALCVDISTCDDPEDAESKREEAAVEMKRLLEEHSSNSNNASSSKSSCLRTVNALLAFCGAVAPTAFEGASLWEAVSVSFSRCRLNRALSGELSTNCASLRACVARIVGTSAFLSLSSSPSASNGQAAPAPSFMRPAQARTTRSKKAVPMIGLKKQLSSPGLTETVQPQQATPQEDGSPRQESPRKNQPNSARGAGGGQGQGQGDDQQRGKFETLMRNTKKNIVKTLRLKGGKESSLAPIEDWGEEEGGGDQDLSSTTAGMGSPTSGSSSFVRAPVPLSDIPPTMSHLPMLPNEVLVSIFPNMLWAYDVHNPDITRSGTAFSTNADFGFVPDEKEEGFRLPLNMISNISKVGKKTGKGELYYITITCHDFRTFRLAVPKFSDQRGPIYELLMEQVFVDSYEQFFAFQRQISDNGNGWSVFHSEEEWSRQFSRLQKGMTVNWRMCINADYSLCSTYPKLLCVPGSVDDSLAVNAAAFRSRQRFPVLSYLHVNGRPICRAAQPNVGIKGHRSTADEELVEAIRVSTSPNDLLYILDARPKVNAVANQAMGKGFESEKLYRQTKIKFLKIANIHVMRDSLRTLAEGIAIGQIASSAGWLDHVRRILVCAITIAAAVHVEKAPCLVHCLAEDHEILTSKGFMGMSEMKQRWNDPSLLVAGYDEAHEALVFERPIKFIMNQRSNQKMVEVAHNHVSLHVTDGHDMYVQCDGERKFSKQKAKILLEGKDFQLMCRAQNGIVRGKEATFFNTLGLFSAEQKNAFMWLYGCWMLTGSYSDASAVFFQSLSSKLLKMLDICRCAYVVEKEGVIVIHCPTWVAFMRQDVWSMIVESASTMQLEALLDGMGMWHQGFVSTNCPQLRDRIVLALLLAGQDASCVHRSHEWYVHPCVADSSPLCPRGSVKSTTYDGNTWCVQMPSGFIVARRKCNDHVVSKPVIIGNCSDGWDRTAQLTSLSMILLDPFYRTIRGFEVLVEKEWLSFGHRFAQRTGHEPRRMANAADQERSPVFLQFVDCVYQLTRLAPCSFEFNELLLNDMMDAVFSCHFGTFLGDSDRDREDLRVKERTESFWSHVNLRQEKLELYRNAFYDPSADPPVILPAILPGSIALWSYYLRCYEKSPKERARPVIAPRTIEQAFRELLHQNAILQVQLGQHK